MFCGNLVFSLGKRHNVVTVVRAVHGTQKYTNGNEELRKNSSPNGYNVLLNRQPNLKMLCRTLVFSLGKRYETVMCVRSMHEATKYTNWIDRLKKDSLPSSSALLNCQPNIKVIKRFKYNKRPKKEEDEEEIEVEFDNDIPEDKNTKVVTAKVNSLRTDLIIKAGLNMARNKVETAFYDSRIRVNGKKIFKKSTNLRIGDEVDLIRGLSPNNPKFLLVSRIELLSANVINEDIKVQFRRNKSLLIENYEEPWKPTDKLEV